MLHLVRKYSNKLMSHPDLNYFALEQSGQKLLDFMDVCNSQPRKMEPHAIRQLVIIIDEHTQLALDAGVKPFPKAHMARHVALQAAIKGNPRFFTTYADEGLNKVFVKIARGCHKLTLQRRLFDKYSGWLDRFDDDTDAPWF